MDSSRNDLRSRSFNLLDSLESTFQSTMKQISSAHINMLQSENYEAPELLSMLPATVFSGLGIFVLIVATIVIL
jgi:hypothetical protein